MTWYRFHLELSNCNDVNWKKLVKSVNSSDKATIQRNENSSPHSNEVNRETSHQHRNIIERLEMKYGVSGGGSDDEEEEPPPLRTLNANDEYEDDDFIDDSALQEVAEGDDMTRRTSTKTKGFFVTDRKLDTTTSNAPATEMKRIVVRRRTRPHPVSPVTPSESVDNKKAKTTKLVCAEPLAAPKFEEEWCPDAETIYSINAFQEVYENHMKSVFVHHKAQAMPKELLPRLSSMDRSVYKKNPLSHKSKGYYQTLADFIPLSIDELHFLISSFYKADVLNDHVSKWTKKMEAEKLSDDEKATGAAGWIMPMDLREGLLELYDIIQDWVDAENLALRALRPGSQLLNLNKERQHILNELQKVIPEELGLDAKALKKNVELERRRQRQKHRLAMKRKSVEDNSEIGGRVVPEVEAMKIDSSQANNRSKTAADTSGGKGNGESQSKCRNKKIKHEDQDENGHVDDMLAAKAVPTGTEFILPSQGFNPLDFVLR